LFPAAGRRKGTNHFGHPLASYPFSRYYKEYGLLFIKGAGKERKLVAKKFVISDHHFGHAGIIDFESRPFSHVEEMTETMIEKWNSVVAQEDIVYHLGDFSFLNQEKTGSILNRLNGYKILIMGNHDRGRTRLWWLEAGFQEVSEHALVYNGFFFLSHEPMYMNKHMPYVNIHGHIHGQKYEGNQYINVCVEHLNYTPILMDTLIKQVVPGEEQ
jgi:calcineurin-like phosphoesterase family protein